MNHILTVPTLATYISKDFLSQLNCTIFAAKDLSTLQRLHEHLIRHNKKDSGSAGRF